MNVYVISLNQTNGLGEEYAHTGTILEARLVSKENLTPEGFRKAYNDAYLTISTNPDLESAEEEFHAIVEYLIDSGRFGYPRVAGYISMTDEMLEANAEDEGVMYHQYEKTSLESVNLEKLENLYKKEKADGDCDCK